MKKHEFLVDLQTATALKALGFKENCNFYFSEFDKKMDIYCSGRYANHNKYKAAFSAPTLMQTQMWIYKKSGLWIEVNAYPNENEFNYSINSFGTICPKVGSKSFKKPEKCLLAAINDALDLIVENEILK